MQLSISSYNRRLLCLLAIVAIPVLIYRNELFSGTNLVLSSPDTDMAAQNFDWLSWGFSEVRKGLLPFWNPHVYCGTPFFEGFQCALLYPLHGLFLVLNPVDAVNYTIVLHLIIGGLGMFLWGTRNRIDPGASLMMALLFMLSSMNVTHIQAGHLQIVNALAWIPFVLASIDANRDGFRPGWVAAGAFFIAMQAVSGHPQTMVYTFYLSVAYTVARLPGCRRKLAFLCSQTVMTAVGILVAMVQLLPGYLSKSETFRAEGLSFAMASFGSLHPSHLIGVLIPTFFGDEVHQQYWGRLYWWEMTFFISITGLCLAVYAACVSKHPLKKPAVCLAGLFFLIATGSHTPLYWFLFHCLPGFNSFRAVARFGIPGSIMLILLAGIALDEIIRCGIRKPGRLFVVPLLLAVALLAGSITLSRSLESGVPLFWKAWMQSNAGSIDFQKDSELIQNESFAERALMHGASALMQGAGVAAVVSLLVLGTGIRSGFRLAIPFLAVFELLVFASASKTVFVPYSAIQGPILDNLRQDGQDTRVLNLTHPNASMRDGLYDIWGCDPLALKRYCELIAFTQGVDPDAASPTLPFNRTHRIFLLLRCRNIIRYVDNQVVLLEAPEPPMPRFSLVPEWRIIEDRDTVFREMDSETFDFSRTVILPQAPGIKPGSDPSLEPLIRIDGFSDRRTELTVTTPDPVILLITDAYHPGWRATGTRDGVEQRYEVMPADYALMGIPLSAGRHTMTLQYTPSGLKTGAVLSGAGAGILIFLVVLEWFMRKKKSAGGSATSLPAGRWQPGTFSEDR